MECRTVAGSLSDYLDGQQTWFSDSQSAEIEQHLVSCPNCQNLQMELGEIRIAARELPLHSPPRALWTRIVNEIELGEASVAGRSESPVESWWERLKARTFIVSLPQMATAMAGLVICAVIGAGVWRGSSPGIDLTRLQTAVLQEEIVRKPEIERQMATINARKGGWSPEFRLGFEQNLTRIEEGLRVCRQRLSAAPDDRGNLEQMRSLLEEKRNLLAEAEKH